MLYILISSLIIAFVSFYIYPLAICFILQIIYPIFLCTCEFWNYNTKNDSLIAVHPLCFISKIVN